MHGIEDEGTRRLQVPGLSEEDKRKPDMLWEFFESQLKPKINFRVHRLHLMECQCRQREDETLDDFILWVCSLARELIIASTPLEDFQRDLLGKAKGYKLANALAEAIVAGRSKLQQLNPSTGEHKLDLLSNKQAQESRSCGNCNTSHKPRKLPAFDSTCHHCGKKGHWRRACRQRKREDLAHTPSTDSKRKIKERKKIHDTASESEDTSDDDIKHDTINIFSICSEVFTTMDVVATRKTGKTPLKLKIDTRASGNTLTLQTFRNLYGMRDPSEVITPVKNTKLTAYNGQKIPCYGSLDLELSHKVKLTKAKFYMVDVEGPWHHRSAYLWEVEVGDYQLQRNQHNRRFISGKPKAGLPRPVWHPWGFPGSSPAAHQTGRRTLHRSSKKMLCAPWRTAKSRAGENG